MDSSVTVYYPYAGILSVVGGDVQGFWEKTPVLLVM
jgi:hypothetical protein